MNRILFSSFLVGLFATAGRIAAQPKPVFSVEEIGRHSGKSTLLPPSGLAIVDINSRLIIRPDREAVRAKVLEVAGQAHIEWELNDKIGRIERILREQERLVTYIRQALETPQQAPDSLLVLLRSTMRDIGNDSLLRGRYNQYSREYTERLRLDPSLREREDRFLYILSRYNESLDSLRAEWKTLEKTARVRFSLRAFRKDRSGGTRLHIENFDYFEQGQFYEVENWAMVIRPEQAQQLQQLQNLAATLNAGTDKTLQELRSKLFQMLPMLTCLEQFPGELRLAGETLPLDLRVILERSWNEARQQLETLRDELMTLSPTADAYDVKGRLLALRRNLDSLYQHTLRSATALPQTNVHVRNMLQCAEQTRSDIERIERFIRTFPEQYLRKVSLTCDDLADEVFRFELDRIPDKGILELTYTGRREVGDEIVLQALLVPQGDTTDRRRFVVVEERTATLVQVGPHSVARVGLIMANPYTLQQPDAAQFRFSPSAALLLKVGSRRSHFYNRFLDPGIGIATTSPDFSLDGIPEFGAGIVATLFRDVASVGWCWNFGLNKPFYFIGVNLPFQLPGMPVGGAQP